MNNIREALHKRSMALSVTSIGAISADNMRFLGMYRYSNYSPISFIRYHLSFNLNFFPDMSAKRDIDERSKKALQILESS